MRDDRLTVVMAGATGFVGTAIRRALAPEFRIVALTRSVADVSRAMGGQSKDDPTEWRNCDLFSLLQLEEMMAGATYAIYLANSKLPSSRLVQGSHEDIGLIMADNFARAAQHCGVRQIIHVGLLAPAASGAGGPASVIEVEKTLGSGAVPLTTLRAGAILGRSQASLRLVNVVRRVPVLVVPDWTHTQIQPIAIDDLTRAVRLCLGNPLYFNGRYDLGGRDVMTFREMLERTAAALGKQRLLVNLKLGARMHSTLWVALLGGASDYLVRPLLATLRHPMVAAPNQLQAAIAPGAKSFDDALRELVDGRAGVMPVPRDRIRAINDEAIRQARRVRSVQRLPLPTTWSAQQVAAEYYRWLPGALPLFLRCDVIPGMAVRVCLRFTRWALIEFTPAPERSSPDRQLLYITGGLLARVGPQRRGRIEFREILDRHCMLVAIHDYTPTLPWFIYRHTQAYFHLWVMRRFGRHLARIKASGETPPISGALPMPEPQQPATVGR